MTEAEWLECADPRPMLDMLWDRIRGRKVRLLGCACCLRITDPPLATSMSRALSISEAIADGRAGQPELSAAMRDAQAEQQRFAPDAPEYLLFTGVTFATLIDTNVGFFKMGLFNLAAAVAQRAVPGVTLEPEDWGVPQDPQWRAVWREEQRAQCSLLREITGNPFRPIAVDPAWLRWNGGTVAHLAQATYDERHLPRGELDRGWLAILADALEASGCTGPEILNHLRDPGLHVRGCWVIDLLREGVIP